MSSYGNRRREYALQCFIMPDCTHHFFAGARVTRAYSLHNDSFAPAKFSFQWKLLDASGKLLGAARDDRDMGSGDLQRGRMSIDLPQATARTTLTLKLTLLADGKLAYEEDRDLDVWPDRPVAAGKFFGRIALYDPRGATANAMRRAGAAFKQINFLTPPDTNGDDRPQALVIGEDAIDATTQADLEKLSAFVHSGGRVLVLAQQRALGGLPVTTSLETREWSSIPFVRTPQHPVLRGVSSWDLHFWSPDRVSARGAYSKPAGGPAIALIDSGGDKGLEWTQMFEAFRGKGGYLVCQLPLIASYDKEPMARELLARTLRYIAGKQLFRQPSRRLELAAQANSPLADKLHKLGVAVDSVRPDAPLSGDAVRMIDGQSLSTLAQKLAAVERAIRDGAVVVLHDISPAEQALASELAGRDVRVAAMPLPNWDGRGCRNGFARLTAGTSQLDFYWKRYEGGEGGWNQADDPSYKIEDMVNYSVWLADSPPGAARELVYPGALLEIPVGKGKLVIDQLRWEAPSDALATQQARVVAAMMLGLGVVVEPPFVEARCRPTWLTFPSTCTPWPIAVSRTTLPTTERAAGPTRGPTPTCGRSRPAHGTSAACPSTLARSRIAASC